MEPSAVTVIPCLPTISPVARTGVAYSATRRELRLCEPQVVMDAAGKGGGCEQARVGAVRDPLQNVTTSVVASSKHKDQVSHYSRQ